MNERTIVFRQGEENGIVVERDNFAHSIFLNQYQQAINIFHSQWTMQKNMPTSLQANCCLDNLFSNVIAFCGDRGEGKTSCMSSFATILTDRDVQAKAKTVLKLPEGFIAPDEVEWLDTIDPSFFDTTHNLLELLLGRMYAKVAEVNRSSNNQECYQAHTLRILKEQFHKVKKDVSLVENKGINYDALEEISDLAAGVNLRADLQKLIDCYLKYMGKKCLLICIDDLDLNISEGYKMAEMLRKYLVCPQCIILVAVKVEQLIDVIATTHMNEVKNTKITWDDCLLMAQKYVTKLLPRGNRVAMPTFTEICEYRLKIADLDDNADDLGINEITVKERIVQLIFQKTGYVFYNARYISPIVPKNLRELRHLLSSLEVLPDAKEADGKDNEIGREVFKEYFFGTWVLKLSNKDQKFAHQLASYDNLTTLNAFVIEYFANRVKEEKIEIRTQSNKKADSDEDSEIYTGDYVPLYIEITNRTNTSTNISLGDVMYVLWFVNTITVNEDIQNLIFFIKAIYSIRLYGCYNEITADKDKSLFTEVDDAKSHISIHKSDHMYDRINRIQRIVNGSYFSYPSGALLSNKRDNFIVDFKKVREDLFDKLKQAVKDSTKCKKEEFVFLLNMCEYFALYITYASTQTNVEQSNFCRTAKTPTFLGVHSHTANRAIFDFLNPFYAITNIKYAYHRFDEILSDNPKKYGENNIEEQNKLYNIALQEENSILSQLKTIRSKDYDDGWDMHGCISDAVIRVIDVQWAIFEELLRQYKTHRTGEIVEKIRLAYKDIQDLQITLYPKINIKNNKVVHTSQAHQLEFEFLDILQRINKEYGSKIEEYLTSLEIQSMIEQIQTPIQFASALSQKIMSIRSWPIKGNTLRKKILDISCLSKEYKNLFDLTLRDIFKNGMMYVQEEVEHKQTNVVAGYMLVAQKIKS